MFSLSNIWFISCTFNLQLPWSGWSGCKLTTPLIKVYVSSIPKQLLLAGHSSLGVVLGECARAAFGLGSCVTVVSPCGAPANKAAELRRLHAELAFAFCHHVLRAGTTGKKLQRFPAQRWAPLLQRGHHTGASDVEISLWSQCKPGWCSWWINPKISPAWT